MISVSRTNPLRVVGDAGQGTVASPTFEPCAIDPSCARCGNGTETRNSLDWSFVDAVYCISLIERPDRLERASAELHRVGLCRRARFYRPARHPRDPIAGIWESHRTIAMDALSRGFEKILVLEDDVKFRRGLDADRLRDVAATLASAPDGWDIFYLGHWPIRVQRIARRLLRTQSGCTHAYVASASAMSWLAANEYRRSQVSHRWSRIIGRGIDAAFASRLATYAYFPMVAVQNSSISDHTAKAKAGRIRRMHHLFTRTRAREYLLSLLMVPNEMRVVAIAVLEEWKTRIASLLRPQQRGVPATRCPDPEPGAVGTVISRTEETAAAPGA
ncbi:MAG TPA: hypothetical protein VGK20_08565 [Candidatus Binatia bacterium]|jgi:hypothetical protein